MRQAEYERWRFGDGQLPRRSAYQMDRVHVQWANGRKCQLQEYTRPVWYSAGRFDGPYPVSGDVVSIHIGSDGDIDALTIHPKVVVVDEGDDIPFNVRGCRG